MQLEDIIKEYIYELQIKNLSNHTIISYKSILYQFKNTTKTETLEEVNKIKVKEYINSMKSRGVKSSSINTNIKVIKSFLKYCFDEDYISEIPIIKNLKEQKTLIQTFNDDEVMRMLKFYKMNTFLDSRNKCLIATLLDTGIRVHELCNLSVKDITETYIVILGKGNKYRVVPISPALKKIMIKYERIRNSYLDKRAINTTYYFVSRTGEQLTNETIQRIVRKVGIKVKVRDNIRCSPHTFRHTCAQAMLKNGLDIYTVSRILGHSDLSMTKRYLQSMKDNEIIEMGLTTSPLMNLR